MNPVLRQNLCDGCGRRLAEGEQVVALVPDVVLTLTKTDESEVRLKLSSEGINARTTKIFCVECLNLSHFELEDEISGLNGV